MTMTNLDPKELWQELIKRIKETIQGHSFGMTTTDLMAFWYNCGLESEKDNWIMLGHFPEQKTGH